MKIYQIVFIMIVTLSSCKKEDKNELKGTRDFRQDMRNFVIGLSKYAKTTNLNFAIIPQNGIELVTTNGQSDGPLATDYLNAIDANGQEDFLYGYDADDQSSPVDHVNYLKAWLNVSKKANKKILVTDYCSTNSKMTDSFNQNNNLGFTSFAASERSLNVIPNFPSKIYQENNLAITNINQVKNFLYLINAEGFNSKSDFLSAIKNTNYDLVIMDLFFNDGTAFTKAEIEQLKLKKNGAKRLVVSYMSIGEAENYRYYWQKDWKKGNPLFLDSENPQWKGNFKVRYWMPEWQKIIYADDNSYLKKIIDANFDGAYLDIIDGFEYFER